MDQQETEQIKAALRNGNKEELERLLGKDVTAVKNYKPDSFSSVGQYLDESGDGDTRGMTRVEQPDGGYLYLNNVDSESTKPEVRSAADEAGFKEEANRSITMANAAEVADRERAEAEIRKLQQYAAAQQGQYLEDGQLYSSEEPQPKEQSERPNFFTQLKDLLIKMLGLSILAKFSGKTVGQASALLAGNTAEWYKKPPTEEPPRRNLNNTPPMTPMAA